MIVRELRPRKQLFTRPMTFPYIVGVSRQPNYEITMRYCSPGNVAIIESLHRRKGSSADKFRKMHLQAPSKQSLKGIDSLREHHCRSCGEFDDLKLSSYFQAMSHQIEEPEVNRFPSYSISSQLSLNPIECPRGASNPLSFAT